MLEGSCHCGSVRWSLSAPVESVTACNCTLCRRYGALWAYSEQGEGVTVSGATHTYSWANEYNDFHSCPRCACLVFYRAKKPNELGLHRTAFNLRTISNPDLIAGLPIDHFDGLVNFEDLPRDHRTVKDLWF